MSSYFPNTEQKQGLEALVTAKDWVAYMKRVGRFADGPIPEAVIFCYQGSLLKHIQEKHSPKPAGGCIRSLTVLSENPKIGVVGGFGVGAPIAVTLLEEMIAVGVKRFLSIGTAGALQKNLKIGDVVLCHKSIRDEGTSHHYLPPAKYVEADRDLTKKCQGALSAMGISYSDGSSWTTDAPYRETVEEVRRYQAEGVSVVEMEAAALFAVAQLRGVPIASIITVSDTLAELAWQPEFHSPQTGAALEQLFAAALKTLE